MTVSRFPLVVANVALETHAIDVTQPYETDRVFVTGHKTAYITVEGTTRPYVGRGDSMAEALGRALEQALGHDGKR